MAINSYKHADNASAGGGDGSSWATSGGTAAYTEAELEAFLEGTVVAGDVIFVKGGTTLTLDSDVSAAARDGTKVSPVAIVGVKSSTTNTGANVVYSDWARTAGDRPFFDCATFQFTTGDYYVVRNLDMQGADTAVLLVGLGCVVENCKFDNDAAVANKQALYVNGGGVIYNNEILSANCHGIYLASNYNRVKFNYIHDIPNAVRGSAVIHTGTANVIEFNIFDNCRIGVYGISEEYSTIDNNTFYGCEIAVSETDGANWACVNNILEGCTSDGFKWTTQTDCNFFWKNHGDDARCNDMWDLVDATTVFQDYEVSTGDPKFTTAGADFSLQSDSPNIDNGMSIDLGVG